MSSTQINSEKIIKKATRNIAHKGDWCVLRHRVAFSSSNSTWTFHVTVQSIDLFTNLAYLRYSMFMSPSLYHYLTIFSTFKLPIHLSLCPYLYISLDLDLSSL